MRRFVADYARTPVNLLPLVLVPMAFVAAAGSLAQIAKRRAGCGPAPRVERRLPLAVVMIGPFCGELPVLGPVVRAAASDAAQRGYNEYGEGQQREAEDRLGHWGSPRQGPAGSGPRENGCIAGRCDPGEGNKRQHQILARNCINPARCNNQPANDQQNSKPA